jgi:Glycosyl hydrolases family 31
LKAAGLAFLLVQLFAQTGDSGRVLAYSRQGNRILLALTDGSADIEWLSDSTFRFRRAWTRPLLAESGRVSPSISLTIVDGTDSVTLETRVLRLILDRKNLRIRVETRAGVSGMVETTAAERHAGNIWCERTAPEGVRYYGLGARTDPGLDARGKTISALKPVLYSTAGYAEAHVAPGHYVFDMAASKPERYTVEIRGAERIDYYFHYGPTPKEAFEQHAIVSTPIDSWSPWRAVLPAKNAELKGSPANLQDQVRGAIHASLSTILMHGFDLAPFENTELYDRASAIAAIMPVHSGTTDTEAIKLRTRMVPFLRSYIEEARERGFPLVRALPFAFPNDAAARDRSDEFLLGDELLIVPMFQPSSERRVYFPRGTWTDLVTEQEVKGPGELSLRMDARRLLPMFARNGSIVPIAPLRESEPLQLNYFPKLAGEFFLFEPDTGEYSQVHAGPAGDLFRLEIESGKDRAYEWVLHHINKPRQVSDGSRQYTESRARDRLAPGRWWYDGAGRKLHVVARVAAGEDHIVHLSI